MPTSLPALLRTNDRHGAGRARAARGGRRGRLHRQSSFQPGACSPIWWLRKLTHQGSLCVIQFLTRSPRWRLITSAYSTNASAVATLGPAAAILLRLRHVPVIQRGKGYDARLKQSIDEAAVEVQPCLVDFARPIGQDARPGDREAVGLEADRLHQGDVVGPAVIVVAGDVAVGAVDDLAGRVGKAIPDGFALAVFLPGAFDLVG